MDRAVTDLVTPNGQTTEYNRVYAKNYDSITGGASGAGPTVSMLHEIFAGVRRLLEIGIGNGRVALPLSEHGYEISGTEISEPMLEEFRLKNGQGESVTAYLCNLADGATGELVERGTFDGAYSSLGVLCCIHDDSQVIELLRETARHTAADARIAIEAYSPAFFQSQVPGTGMKSVMSLPGGGQANSLTTLEKEGRFAHMETTISGFDSLGAGTCGTFSERIRLRGSDDFESLLAEAGWEVLVNDPATKDSPFYWILATK